MRNKHRNVSHDNAFHPLNKPPQQYLDVEKILEKPGKLTLSYLDKKSILSDPKHAKHFTTGPWDFV
jgi:hypothetical protein